MECPECSGKGKVRFFEPGRPTVAFRPCGVCAGRGELAGVASKRAKKILDGVGDGENVELGWMEQRHHHFYALCTLGAIELTGNEHPEVVEFALTEDRLDMVVRFRYDKRWFWVHRNGEHPCANVEWFWISNAGSLMVGVEPEPEVSENDQRWTMASAMGLDPLDAELASIADVEVHEPRDMDLDEMGEDFP